MTEFRVYSFEKLTVWSDTRLLIKMIYTVSSSFPEDEKFGLTSQLRRAAISISSNLAEGSGRSNDKEQKQFYRIAYASLMEVLSQLIVATDLGFMDEKTLNKEIRPQIEIVSLKLYGLKK